MLWRRVTYFWHIRVRVIFKTNIYLERENDQKSGHRLTAPSPPSRQWPFKIEFSQSDISKRNSLYYELLCLVKCFFSFYAAHARVAPNSGQLMQGIQLAQQTNKCNNKKQGQWNFTHRFDIRRKKKPGNIYYAFKALLCGIMYIKGLGFPHVLCRTFIWLG